MTVYVVVYEALSHIPSCDPGMWMLVKRQKFRRIKTV